MIIETKDEIVQAVLHKMDQRSLIGQKKYGATMMQEIVGQEELMDALLYIEAAKRCLADEVEEAMLNRINVEYDKVSPCSAHAFEEDDERMNIIAQNGNTGEHYEKTL